MREIAQFVRSKLLRRNNLSRKNGGEGGIRTPVPVTRQDAFEAPPLRPLRYLSIYYFARWGPFRFPISLRARGRLRRLPSGARLRRHFARWSLLHSPPRCALAVAFGDFPPALACGGTS